MGVIQQWAEHNAADRAVNNTNRAETAEGTSDKLSAQIWARIKLPSWIALLLIFAVRSINNDSEKTPPNHQSQVMGSHSGTEQIQLCSVQNTAVGRCT